MNVAVGNNTTSTLADIADTILASARARREYDEVIPQLADRYDLDANSGISWKEVVFEKLNAQAVDENTVLNNPQRYTSTPQTVTPQMIQIQTVITEIGRAHV